MEFEFLKWLAAESGAHSPTHPDIPVGLGDDGAVLNVDDGPLVVVHDAIADGTHFKLGSVGLEQIGRKALAVNLSDLAAMGACAEFATVHFQLPKELQLEDAKQLFRGLLSLAKRFGVQIVGGDTNIWNHGLVISVMVAGRLIAPSAWTLAGAQLGDAIVVSGTFGGSRISKHLNFIPRLDLPEKLAGRFQINAATDVSDSLSVDLSRLLDASRCGGLIEVEKIPISADVDLWMKQCSAPHSRVQHALADGEDFELILTLPVSEWDRIPANIKLDLQLTRIGTTTDKLGVFDSTGNVIEIKGYEH